MKVVILCGGRGMRLHEETEFKPKPLVAIGGKPILWHIMKIYSHYGHRDFILCLGYKGQMIKDYFLNFDETHNNFTLKLGPSQKQITYHNKKSVDDWNITFVDTGLDTNTGGRIARIKDFLGRDEDFFLTYGDGVADININALSEYHKKAGGIATLSGVRPLTPFGVIEPVGGLVKNFTEKPQARGFVSGGFFVCNKKLFNYLAPDESCVFEQEPLRKLAAEGALAVYEHQGFWHCLDTYKHLEDLNDFYKQGKRPWMVWESR